MFPAKFAYAAPSSLQEALGLLEDPEAKILAGGHSLLPLMKLRLAQPRLLVDIGRIPGLAYVRGEDGVLAIGAMTTYRESGERDIDLDGFFVDMLTTALQEREIIREVRLNAQPSGAGAAYHKFDQPASHYALTGVCAVISMNGGSIASARIGVTGVGPKAYRPTAVEQALVGKPAEKEAVDAAVKSVADGIDVQGDIHASPEYRAHLARVLTRRAVLQAAERARG